MNPTLTVEVTRGGMVESTHPVHIVVASKDGLEVWGDAARLTFPRSAAKILQALPMVESGAAARLGLTSTQLALSCASHGGEARHASAVGAWLGQLGLDHECLECGQHWPMYEPAGREMAAAGTPLSTLYNNCSGKHAGFVSFARDQGWDIADYIQPEHRVQQAIRATSEELLETELGPMGIDGCGIPTHANRLDDLALAFYRLTQAKSGARHGAVSALVSAHQSDAFMIGGSGRLCTQVNEKLRDGMVKFGAEGVYCATFPNAEIGIALKAEDGTVRAAEVALMWLLKRLGLLDPGALPERLPELLKNRAGVTVGEVRVSAA